MNSLCCGYNVMTQWSERPKGGWEHNEGNTKKELEKLLTNELHGV
jgi:hypothetical protein